MSRDQTAMLLARLDELERAATYDRNMGHYRRAAIDYPVHTLAGIAEDRDLLARHKSDEIPADAPSLWWCEACSDESSEQYVAWPCAEWLSVAHRHRIEVPE